MQKAKHCMFPPHSTIPICRVCFSAFALSTVKGEKINIQVSETEEVGVFAIVGLKSLCGLPTHQSTPSSEAISNLGPGDPSHKQSQASWAEFHYGPLHSRIPTHNSETHLVVLLLRCALNGTSPVRIHF